MKPEIKWATANIVLAIGEGERLRSDRSTKLNVSSSIEL